MLVFALLTWIECCGCCPRGASVPGVPLGRALLQCPRCSGLGSSRPPPRLSPSVSYSLLWELSSTSGSDSCLRHRELLPLLQVGWLGSHFPPGTRVSCYFPLSLESVGSVEPRDLPCTRTNSLFFFTMAGALRGRIGTISQLLLDLGMTPTPDHPVSVEIRCDCLAIFPRNQALPLSVTTGFCLLSTRGARALGGRVRLLDWCNAHGFSLTFGCPIFGLLENGEVFLWAHRPPEPGMEE